MIVSLLPLHAKPTGGYFATSHPSFDKFYVIFKNEMERVFFLFRGLDRRYRFLT